MPCFDTHWHREFLNPKLVKGRHFRRGQLWTLTDLAAVHPFPFPPDFVGGIADWCRPANYGSARAALESDPQVWGAFGCHPHFAKEYNLRVEQDILERFVHLPRVVAWGEMGLDYSTTKGRNPDKVRQRQVLHHQLAAALRHGKPIVIHGREAEEDLLKVMKRVVPRDHPIHRHCVTVPPKELEPFVRYFSEAKFGFTNALLRGGSFGRGIEETIASLPLHRILAETDAPYHPPPSWRPSCTPWSRSRAAGCSHPGMVSEVVAAVARIKDIPLHEVAQRIYLNSAKLYDL